MPASRTLFLLLAAAAAAACDRGPPPEPPGLAAAEGKLAEGRYGEALRDLRAIPTPDLPDPAARLRAARAAAKAEDFPLALRFLPPGPADSPEVRLLRAESLLRSGDAAGAKQALAALERDGHRGERWRFLHALRCLVEGERDLGVAELDALVREGSRDPEVLVRWAETALARPDEAAWRLKESLPKASDRGPVLAALGAVLLRLGGEVELARLHLEEAVRLCPWDREARLDLVRAGMQRGGAAALDAAGAEAARLVEQDPADVAARLLLAESFAEKGRLSVEPSTGIPTPASVREWTLAEKEYGVLLAGTFDDPSSAIRALQGLARIHVAEILLDPPGGAIFPGSHYERAMELLRRAEALDPSGRLEGGPYGSRLLAETWFLRGRASRKAHTGASDHTEALEWLTKAFRCDPRHLDASWDLGLLCHDFLGNSKEYNELAAEAFRAHVHMRARLRQPDLDPERLRIVEEAMKRAGRSLFPGPGDKPPPKPPPK